MHELSIANSLVELVEQQVAEDELASIRCIKLRIGALSCVHRDSLLFCFNLVTQDTMLRESKLEIETVPVEIYCSTCQSVQLLPGIQSFRCPACGTASGDIRQGRELELHSIEFESAAPVT